MAVSRSSGGGSSRSRADGGFRCSECGTEAIRWAGRCPRCQAWGTLEAQRAAPRKAAVPGSGATAAALVTTPARPVTEVDPTPAQRRATGVDELDRVLGGGMVPGAVILLAGEPGVGKSTLLLEVGARSAEAGHRALIVTGEESAAQVRLRAGRTGTLHADLWLAAETDLGALLGHVEEVKPTLLVVDSVQTISASGVDGVAGGVTQVREVAAALIRTAKALGLATVLVGHVTKDGSVAGPRLLEHLVDVVLHFEGDQHTALRMIRAVKNRYGPTDEVGCFEMNENGIWGIADPSGLFLSRGATASAVPGVCVTVMVEGRRPLVAEVQALVAQQSSPFKGGGGGAGGAAPAPLPPRRAVSGLDGSRVAMITAVLQKRAGFAMLGGSDIFTASIGGVRLHEPAADLAVALAMVSSAQERAVPPDLIALGEVGLTGEIRAVSGVERRLAAAARLGFRRALVPRLSGMTPEGMTVTEVTDVNTAISNMYVG
ncbi:DNA repair protein RadA [Frankia sp. CNm7]|uniref:DNA repair protein RadA n=1 Tax=Frankia nepalensis TaxID=1836974 RepID=A0A937UUF6_9ACTN|nr:DNA repair protein RadA [Frankia nepalensis]MBL7496199.1 DNA repair protein RadA [Frankia nepalensis]MBL7511662.1 DNA repair protein RadA [Frankia nepalensis]MBL7523222.1 DNA repair protein RadA [Frankia nepalensis]MBL7631096.1 DNA repair protein RadA [Frankia nepalensis]